MDIPLAHFRPYEGLPPLGPSSDHLAPLSASNNNGDNEGVHFLPVWVLIGLILPAMFALALCVTLKRMRHGLSWIQVFVRLLAPIVPTPRLAFREEDSWYIGYCLSLPPEDRTTAMTMSTALLGSNISLLMFQNSPVSPWVTVAGVSSMGFASAGFILSQTPVHICFMNVAEDRIGGGDYPCEPVSVRALPSPLVLLLWSSISFFAAFVYLIFDPPGPTTSWAPVFGLGITWLNLTIISKSGSPKNQRTLSVLKSRQDSWSHWAPGVQVWSANSTAADRWAIPPSDLGTALHFDTATKLQSIINTLAIVAEDDSLGEHVFFPTGFENTIGTPPFGSSFVHDNASKKTIMQVSSTTDTSAVFDACYSGTVRDFETRQGIETFPAPLYSPPQVTGRMPGHYSPCTPVWGDTYLRTMAFEDFVSNYPVSLVSHQPQELSPTIDGVTVPKPDPGDTMLRLPATVVE